MKNRLPLVILFLFFVFSLLTPALASAQAPDTASGDTADFYAGWARDAIKDGRWTAALNALERAGDYSGVSSDLSYMLAAARNHLNRPAGSVLAALEKALEAGVWRDYSAADALLLKAELLVRLKRYGEALPVLSALPESVKSVELKLKALRFLPAHAEFRAFMTYALDRYPREKEPARIFLDFLQSERGAGRFPTENDRNLLELILRRLPALLLRDPDLAWIAAPFMRGEEEARRLVASYRAVNKPVPFSLPAALNLGVIDEETALAELFNPETVPPLLYRPLLEEINGLLRDETRRELFTRNLSRWTGVIKEDTDGDGFYEAEALYNNGLLAFYTLDENQDLLIDLALEFEAGEPKTAAVSALAETEDRRPPYPLRKEDEAKITVLWEKFPSLAEAGMNGETYFFRPFDFNYAPVIFNLVAGGGLLFPEADSQSLALGRRSLVSGCLKLERPGREFPLASETVTLNRGIPVRAEERLDGRLVSETDFIRGRPLAQRVDLDLDGRLETVRRFRRVPSPPGEPLDPLESLVDYTRDFEYADSDWDGDGIFETRQFF